MGPLFQAQGHSPAPEPRERRIDGGGRAERGGAGAEAEGAPRETQGIRLKGMMMNRSHLFDVVEKCWRFGVANRDELSIMNNRPEKLKRIPLFSILASSSFG